MRHDGHKQDKEIYIQENYYLFSGHGDDDIPHIEGVAFVLARVAQRALI